MNTKARMVFLAGALAVTLASGWGSASAAAIYESHFDLYRAATSADAGKGASAARDRGTRVRHRQVARHRPLPAPAAMPVAANDKSGGGR